MKNENLSLWFWTISFFFVKKIDVKSLWKIFLNIFFDLLVFPLFMFLVKHSKVFFFPLIAFLSFTLQPTK